MYVHLASHRAHAEKCTHQRCVGACEWQRFRDWLDEPLLASDHRKDERFRQRREALMRGDVPA